MKRRYSGLFGVLALAVVFIMFMGTSVQAAGNINISDQDIRGYWRFWKGVTFKDNVTFTDSTVNGLTVERAINFPINAVFFENTAAPLSTSTTPGLEVSSSMAAVVWSDGETSRVGVQFMIPGDYYSGGAFRLFCTQGSMTTTTPEKVDFHVLLNSNGAAADSTVTAYSAVSLVGTTPEVVILTPSTDQSSFAADKQVTLYLWRDDSTGSVAVATGTADLRIHGIQFYYTAKPKD